MTFSTPHAKTLKKAVLSDFRGVDYSNPEGEVKGGRAIEEENFFIQKGVNQKRRGWKQLLSFDTPTYYSVVEGVFCYSLGGRDYTLAYVSRYYKNPPITDYTGEERIYAYSTFFRILSDYSFVDMVGNGVGGVCRARLQPRKPQCYPLGDKVYFVGMGDYLVIHEDEPTTLVRVETDALTYIPTTTISIENTMVNDEVREIIDDVSLVTRKRKNKLVGCTTIGDNSVSSDHPASFLLDGIADGRQPITVKIQTKEGGNIKNYTLTQGTSTSNRALALGDNLGGVSINIASTFLNNLSTIELTLRESAPLVKCGGGYIMVEKTAESFNLFYVADRYTPQNAVGKTPYHYSGNDLVNIISNGTLASGMESFVLPATFGEVIWINKEALEEFTPLNKIFAGLIGVALPTLSDTLTGENPGGVGSVTWGCMVGSNGKFSAISLYYPTEPIVPDISNIEITFSSLYGGGESWCERMEFGTLFGEGGRRDRLFVKGELPNKVWFSGSEELSYFGDLDYLVVGFSQSEISGFLPLSEQALAIFKKGGYGDANVYLASAYQKEVEEGIYRTSFALSAGHVTEGCVNHQCVQNLAGDYLYLSQNGVFGLCADKDSVATRRYAVCRSNLINPAIQGATLLSAMTFLWKNLFFLVLEGGTCYVASSDYTYTERCNVGYEWWKLVNIPINCVAEKESELIFGTRSGEICAFYDGYEDILWTRGGSGDLTVDSETDLITYNSSFPSPEDCDFVMLDESVSNCYGILVDGSMGGDVLGVNGNRLLLSDNAFNLLREGEKVYLENPLPLSMAYYVRDKRESDNSITLTLPNGNTNNFLSLTIRIFCKLNVGERYMVKGLDTINKTFYLADCLGRRLRLATFGDYGVNFVGKFCKKENVKAKWITPALSFGTPENRKSLYSLSIVASNMDFGRMQMGYDTGRIMGRGERSIKVFDFCETDFEDFSLDTSFVGCATLKIGNKKFNHLRIRMSSQENCPCSLEKIIVKYKVNRATRGVM